MRYNILVLLVLILFSVSCEYKPVHPDLWTFQKNEDEFQKVLDYYNKPADSLKLKAAEYLLRNMDNHFSYIAENEEEVDQFFQSIDKLVTINYPKNTKLYEVLRQILIDNIISEGLSTGNLSKPHYKRSPDISEVKAEYLIENIEYAFKAWDFPWARAYSFDDFCTYILPYRSGNEPMSSWRKAFYEEFKWVADSVRNPKNVIEVVSLVNTQFKNVLSYSAPLKKHGFKLKVTNQLDAMVFGSCQNQTGLGICALRSIGIAATVVNIPKWGRWSWGHETIGVINPEKEWRCFNLGGPGPVAQKQPDAPKIFFKYFDKMNHFKPVLEDASNILMNAFDLEINVDAKDNDDVYLCVFGNLDWYPLCSGKSIKSKVVFENIGNIENMYLAAVKSRGKLKPVSSLFSVDTLGNITYYNPNNTKFIEANLTRKYPGIKNSVRRINALVDGKFSVASNKDFGNRIELLKVDTTLNYDHNIIEIVKQEGKYFRYDFPQSLDSVFDGPAEISFYTTVNNAPKKIDGKYFGSPQLSQKHIELMTDNNLLTYVEIWDCQKEMEIETGKIILRKDKQPIWIEMEQDSVTEVTHIGICPRNDKNGIYAEMHYELFYWDDEWKSLGEKVATGDFIRFDGIPENAVLWLRNLDEGKEERIFVMEEGEQMWW